jgi:hypothetical protein
MVQDAGKVALRFCSRKLAQASKGKVQKMAKRFLPQSEQPRRSDTQPLAAIFSPTSIILISFVLQQNQSIAFFNYGSCNLRNAHHMNTADPR